MIGKIYINGQIGTFDDVKGVELIDIIGQVKAQPEAISFEVHINSEGGIVDTGLDIYNYIKSLGKPVTTIGSGIVASIATAIFMAGDERKVMPNTQFMIHMPWGSTEGNSDEIKEFASQLEAYEKKLLDFYKKTLDLPEEAVRPLLREETWLSAEQLTTLGFTNKSYLQIAAKAIIQIEDKPNNNKMNDLTEKDKGWLEGLFNKILAKNKNKVLNKLVQDATGAEIDFGELADDAVIEVGATATVGDSPAEGEYLLPDGTTYVFVAGELTEIKPAEEETELDVANARIAELEGELEQTKAIALAAEKEVTDIKTDVVALRKQVMSRFKIDTKKEAKQETDKLSGLNNYLNSKK